MKGNLSSTSIVLDGPASHYSWEFSAETATRAMRWILAAGIVLRLVAIQWPADYHMLNSWRESDYTQIARSFYREGMNILYPRVDWRGSTTGFVEMEFPIIPWTAAALYRAFGYHEQILRLLSALASVGALFAFRGLATRLLRPTGALLATALFAFNGLVISMAWCIQPESLFLLLTILAAEAMLRWEEVESPQALLAACGLLSAAILVKSPAAHLGFMLAFLVLKKKGWGAFRDPYVYLGTVISLLPGVFWYAWAHHLYLATGLSMGISNESHFLNWEVIRDPLLILGGNAYAEFLDGFGFFGVFLTAGILFTRGGMAIFPLAWYCSVLLFYIVIADTSGDAWAYYYHCISAAPAALLISVGSLTLMKQLAGGGHEGSGRNPARAIIIACICSVVLVFSMRGSHLWGELGNNGDGVEYACMRQFSQAIPAGERIVVRGGRKHDSHGHEVAYNVSYFFAWMDRKGLNYPREDFNIELIDRIGREGTRFWLASPDDLAAHDVRSTALSRYTLVSQCGNFLLFDIRGPKQQ